MQLGDREMLEDLINSEKEIIKLYSTGLTESTCRNMRQVIMQNIGQADKDQYDVFDRMSTLGYYPTKTADKDDVEQAKRQYGQVQQQL